MADQYAKTRFDRFHTDSNVALVERIALMALDAEEQTGQAILYMTKQDIADELGVSAAAVSVAMRLSYTAEFADQYGYTFVPPGNGRSGTRHGYVLEHDRAKSATKEARDLLNDTDTKLADHLRGAAMHWHMIRVAHGGNTRVGKVAGRVNEILTGAAAAVESVLDDLD